MTYLLDANALMEASRLYCGFDIAPGFWQWLANPSLHSRVGSVDAVKREIQAGHGPLVSWARGLPLGFWVAEGPSTVGSLAAAMSWVSDSSRAYGQDARSGFAASADLRLIAVAHAEGHSVVTRETRSPDSRKRVKIPDVCDALGVPCVQPFDAYRDLGLRLT